MTMPPTLLCPLCHSDLYLARTFTIPLSDTTDRQDDPQGSVTDSWEVVCEQDHRIAAGDKESDGREAWHGVREALSRAGAR